MLHLCSFVCHPKETSEDQLQLLRPACGFNGQLAAHQAWLDKVSKRHVTSFKSLPCSVCLVAFANA
eukprot:1158857-Pelagomonas_calceolata.AAC.2